MYIVHGVIAGRKLSLLEADCAVYTKQMMELKRWEQAQYTRVEANHIANLTGSFGTAESPQEGEVLFGLDPSFYIDSPGLKNDVQSVRNCLYSILGYHKEGADLSLARGDTSQEGLQRDKPDAFHRALCSFEIARQTKKAKYRRHAQRQRSLIKLWTKKGCPNTIHYKLVLDAENAALRKKHSKAKELYQEAIEASIAS